MVKSDELEVGRCHYATEVQRVHSSRKYGNTMITADVLVIECYIQWYVILTFNNLIVTDMVVIRVSACWDVLFPILNSITLAVNYTFQQKLFIIRLQCSYWGTEVQFPGEETDFSLHQTGSEALWTSCLMSTREFLPNIKLARAWINSTPSTNADSKLSYTGAHGSINS